MSDEKEKKFEPKAGVPPVVRSVAGEEEEEEAENPEEASNQNDSSPENKSDKEK